METQLGEVLLDELHATIRPDLIFAGGANPAELQRAGRKDRTVFAFAPTLRFGDVNIVSGQKRIGGGERRQVRRKEAEKVGVKRRL
eukprot:8584408-Prorocentrum_lima.AAC.1